MTDATPAELGKRAWKEELRIVSKWIEEHPALLTVLAFLLPSSGLYHFVTADHIPLELASSDVIAALPLLLVRISFLVIMLSALFALPALMVFEGAVREQDGSIRVFPPFIRRRRRKLGPRAKKLLLWLLALSVPGLAIAAALAVDAMLDQSDAPVVPVAIGVGVVAFVVITRGIRRSAQNGESLHEFTALSAAAGVTQMMAALFCMQFALRYVPSATHDGLVFALLLFAVFILAFVQITIVVVIEQTSRHAGFVRQGFVGALCLVSIAFIFPHSGAALTGMALRDTASGGHRCVRLAMTAESADFRTLIHKNAAGAGRTVGLNLLSNLGGTYLARIRGDKEKTVYRIPTDKVVSMAPCEQ